MSGMPKMILVLSLLCGLSGLALSSLKSATAPRIEEQILTYVQGPALGLVFAGTDNSPIADRRVFELEGRKVTVFPAFQAGKLAGVALEEKSPGYGGDIGVMVGFNLDSGPASSLAGIGITTLRETPGLGMRVAEPDFGGQFAGKQVGSTDDDKLALSASGGNIDAISGATISSSAVVDAVNRASRTWQALRPEIVKTFSSGKPATAAGE